MTRFRRLAAGTAVLAAVTMLLGVFTAAEGAGLTCAQRWPLCDGPLGGCSPRTTSASSSGSTASSRA
ncbi:hypothetical protein [Halosegnis marinus]|uniref:hypothetical protein n=1 Tax=Halosegnis marinus TaxID=3034023 RepID=UPI00361C1349